MQIIDDGNVGGINMIPVAFAIWSLMKRKFSTAVTVAVAVNKEVGWMWIIGWLKAIVPSRCSK